MPTWEKQINQWKTVLTELSREFYQGVATVDPKDHPETCTWCSLKSLCRIDEEVIG